MPLLGSLLVKLFGGLAAWLVTILGRKLAVSTAAVASLAAITTALIVTFRALMAPLLQAMFQTQYGQFMGLAFPPVAGNCIAAIGATWAACALYRWQKSAISLAVQS